MPSGCSVFLRPTACDMEKLAIFDLDGTLSDSGPGIMKCVQYAFRKMGFPEQPEEVLRSFIGPPLDPQFMKTGPMTAEEASRAVDFFRERYDDTGKFENMVYDGIPELLRDLKKRGCLLAVATSKPAYFTEQILDHFGLMDTFDAVSAAGLDETKTDKAQLIRHALDMLGFSNRREDAVMAGDREYDIIGARQAGVRSVGVLYGYGSREELCAAGAGAIAGSTAELRKILLDFTLRSESSLLYPLL